VKSRDEIHEHPEWKVEKDSPTDTHRHLSHLIGLYPGYAIANFDPSPTIQGNGPAKSYTQNDILNAAETSLIHRGNGTGPDADSGWEKVWRAAAWAQLKNSSTFYHELSVSTTNFSLLTFINRDVLIRSLQSLKTLARICLACTIHTILIPYSKSTPTLDIRLQSW